MKNEEIMKRIYKKYIEISEKIEKELKITKNKEIIKNKEIENIINKEIEKIINEKNLDKYQLAFINGKPIGIYKEKEDKLNIFFTTIALAIVVNRKNPNFGKFVERIKNGRFELYKKENRAFFKFFDEVGNRRISDRRMFIFNFSKKKRLNDEIDIIINRIIKDRKEKKKKIKEPKEFYAESI